MDGSGQRNILLVDDQSSFLASLADGLQAANGNFRILTAENGDQAVKVLGSAPVDVVVTDLKMPVMNGFELLSHMQKDYPAIPVIVMSSYLDAFVEAQIRDLGALQLIDKASLSFEALGEIITHAWKGD